MSKANKDPMGYEPGYDPRLDFLLDLLTKSLKVKPDKWVKMYAMEEYRSMVHEFFDRTEAPNLVIFWTNALGQLMATTSFPMPSKSKGVYMMKKDPGKVIPKDENIFKDNLIYGDLAAQPLECLVSLIEEVVNPLITTSCNQETWPEQVVGDVKQNVQQVTSVLYSVQGQLRGRTQLPLPLNLDLVDENERHLKELGPGEVDLQLKTQIESLMIKWAQQINEVLKQDSSKALQNGNHPSPAAELNFWEERVLDLQCVYEQMNAEKVQKLAGILEGTKSAYWPAFRSMFVNVVGALAEAQDILVYLKPLKKHIDNVQSSSFDDLMTTMRPLLHCVCLVWANSKFYCSAARIIVLLQEICNLLIEAARNHLGGSTIFQLDPEEGLSKLTLVVNTLRFFRDLYDEHRSKIKIYFDKTQNQQIEVKTWDFLPRLVFSRFDKFYDRMVNLRDFFESSTEYYKLERVDFGGTIGRSLTSTTQKIYTEFLEFYQQYGSLTYDVSDPDDLSFDVDYAAFKSKIADNDHRLAAICVNAFQDCHTSESVFKLILILGTLLDRPAIKKDMGPKMPMYIRMIEQDFHFFHEMLEDQILAFEDPSERREVQRSIPPYSASVHWAKNMLTGIYP